MKKISLALLLFSSIGLGGSALVAGFEPHPPGTAPAVEVVERIPLPPYTAPVLVENMPPEPRTAPLV